MKDKDIKIDVDFKDTCIDFAEYAIDLFDNSDCDTLAELWVQYQEKITEEVFKVLNQEPCCKINPKMLLSKEELGLDNRVPDYYRGKNGYEARKVCDNFELPYHLATATTYILRAYHKHDTPIDCITKAIAHLEFELDKLKND